mmetsp:Transcript_52572/g.83725  ORF Transcript_52572/g.83725 Transcript_52572/m.83725 type:complete len:316 (+) Transcript_52572:418-1365(+)
MFVMIVVVVVVVVFSVHRKYLGVVLVFRVLDVNVLFKLYVFVYFTLENGTGSVRSRRIFFIGFVKRFDGVQCIKCFEGTNASISTRYAGRSGLANMIGFIAAGAAARCRRIDICHCGRLRYIIGQLWYWLTILIGGGHCHSQILLVFVWFWSDVGSGSRLYIRARMLLIIRRNRSVFFISTQRLFVVHFDVESIIIMVCTGIGTVLYVAMIQRRLYVRIWSDRDFQLFLGAFVCTSSVTCITLTVPLCILIVLAGVCHMVARSFFFVLLIVMLGAVGLAFLVMAMVLLFFVSAWRRFFVFFLMLRWLIRSWFASL